MFKAGDTKMMFSVKKNRILSEEAALKKGTNALTKYVWGPFGSDSLTHPN